MKQWLIKLIALALALLLAGCTLPWEEELVAFPDMQYQHPQLTELENAYEKTLAAADTGDLDATVAAFNEFYILYERFYTDSALADIYYCKDITDSYWEEEYGYCMELSPRVDELYEDICYGLADSSLREELEAPAYFGEGFFDDYQGENLWDEHFSALLEEEANILDRYYQLSEESLEYEMGTHAYYEAYGEPLAQVLAELVILRQEISAYYGYDTYADFAWDFYYYRDYTPGQTRNYIDRIRQELVPLYQQLDYTMWLGVSGFCTEQEALAYVRTAAENMGGRVEESFQTMVDYRLHDTAYGENKHNISFEVYLPTYTLPYVFVNASGTEYDKLTVTHEFGHFCNDYISYGSYAGIDVKEIFSQGMEFLSLCYTNADEGLIRAKLADSLCVYVEQAAYADFEMRIYSLPADQITPQKIAETFGQVMEDYGISGYNSYAFIGVPHFYSHPMYVISYVVSNDAAMQIYQLELAQPGAGLAMLEDNLDTQDAYFLEFLTNAGLDSPFVVKRIPQVAQTFREFLTQ